MTNGQRAKRLRLVWQQEKKNTKCQRMITTRRQRRVWMPGCAAWIGLSEKQHRRGEKKEEKERYARETNKNANEDDVSQFHFFVLFFLSKIMYKNKIGWREAWVRADDVHTNISYDGNIVTDSPVFWASRNACKWEQAILLFYFVQNYRILSPFSALSSHTPAIPFAAINFARIGNKKRRLSFEDSRSRILPSHLINLKRAQHQTIIRFICEYETNTATKRWTD